MPAVPTFLAPGTGLVEDNSSMTTGWRGWFGDDSSALLLLCTSDHQALDPEVGYSWNML